MRVSLRTVLVVWAAGALFDRVWPLHAQTDDAILPLLIMAAAMAAKKGIDAHNKAKAAKMGAKNDQTAAQYQVNTAQKGINKKALNFASLLKALHREGWYGDQLDADGHSTAGFVKDKGVYNPDDWRLDDVPQAATPGILGSTVSGAATGALDAYTGYMGDKQAATLQAALQARSKPPTVLPAANTSFNYLAPRR